MKSLFATSFFSVFLALAPIVACSSSDDDSKGNTPQNATCDQACGNLATACGQAVSGCDTACTDWTSEQRSCMKNASNCAAIQGCLTGSPGPDGGTDANTAPSGTSCDPPQPADVSSGTAKCAAGCQTTSFSGKIWCTKSCNDSNRCQTGYRCSPNSVCAKECSDDSECTSVGLKCSTFDHVCT